MENKQTIQMIHIDEELCDGCGLCVHACEGGALEIINGKAKVTDDAKCDGLGACVGDCPKGAIELVERPAEPFDPNAVLEHHLELDRKAGEAEKQEKRPAVPEPEVQPSKLGNWPVQLRLVPVHSSTFEGAKLLVAADCTPFAYRDFHSTFMEDRTVLIGCPKHEDADIYREKLVQLFRDQNIESVDIVVMEVPCCQGLLAIVQEALQEAGKTCKLTTSRVSVKGELSEHNKPITLK